MHPHMLRRCQEVDLLNHDKKWSMFEVALRWHEQGQKVAIATVVSTWGSSPCPVGSQLVVSEARQFAGSVSGGCVETAVIEEAVDVLDRATPRLLSYGVSNEQAWEVGLACGGQIEVYVEPLVDDGEEND